MSTNAKTNTYENSLLLLVFNATTFEKIAQNDGSSPATSLYVSLHTDSPGEGGDQTTNEADYTGYARVGVLRTGAGWTVSGNQATNVAAIEFPECTGGSNTATYVGIGTDSSGAGTLLYFGAVDDPSTGLAISENITPTIAIGALTVDEE